VFLPLFELFEPETIGFAAAQTAGQQQHKKRAICKRGVLLSITHKLGSDHNTQFNIG
jgi:hypothetical protein